MTHQESVGSPTLDDDSVGNASPPKKRKTGVFQFEVHVGRKTQTPPSPGESGYEILERSEKEDAAFLEAVQRSLPSFGLKAGGRATDFRALKYWDMESHMTDGPYAKHDAHKEAIWKKMRKAYAPFFDVADADENDFVVIVEYPTGEQAAIHVRRVRPE